MSGIIDKIRELKAIHERLNPGFFASLWRHELNEDRRAELEARQRELSIAVWNEMKSIKYFKKSVRNVNDEDELMAEHRRLKRDLQCAWLGHYGVIVDKDQLLSYGRYLTVKLNDLQGIVTAEHYQDGQAKVNMVEELEYYRAERGIDLSEHSVIDLYYTEHDPEAQHELDQFFRKGRMGLRGKRY